ncbi:divergent protein kinase domain 2A-like [Patiria miniata]|uniref:FAM69 protein-kinase domain-containing protein n=1 Tax=Patiria miniata TaxID=46514 RepID=A0A914BS69_PATMI|nr:divergent protein kinase domain 2A-like [Patiria miniata]XP_038078356.1 divergent protein kinase domain 2A-like [Patiria miniata]XP_038078357.1 divergent protein kinase domain 2A-like [Patiria miniata]XP_038078358.1 divergent protein kinase domain 2A-like [Patiria miniata]
MLAFRVRRRMGLLLGLLLCSLVSVQLFNLSLGSFERTAKDYPNSGLPTSQDPWNFGTWKEGQTRSDNAKVKSLKDFGVGVMEYAGQGGGNQEIIAEKQSLESTSRISTQPLRRFSKVSPAVLQEEKCPGCYGTTLCDKFYAGNITLDMETAGQAKRKGVFFGHMEGQRIVGKHLADPSEFKRLDHFVCQNSSRRIRPNQSCDVSWDILHSHLASRMALDVEYIRKDAHKVAQKTPSSLGLALCASDRFLGQLKDLYGLNRWTRDCSPEIATLMTSLILNPEGLLLKFFQQYVPELQKYFPTYLGECGRMIVVAEAGEPLSEYLDASWDVRADLSRQILQMIYDFQNASSDWMVVFADFRYENFAVTTDGRIQLLDLEDIMIIDKREIVPAKKRPSECNEECFVSFTKSLFQSEGQDCGVVPHHSQMMLLLACHKILSDLESTKYLRYFYDEKEKQVSTVGLLHDVPDILEPNMSNLLYNCVFESSPGQRIQSANILKRLLEVTGRGFMRS